MKDPEVQSHELKRIARHVHSRSRPSARVGHSSSRTPREQRVTVGKYRMVGIVVPSPATDHAGRPTSGSRSIAAELAERPSSLGIGEQASGEHIIAPQLFACRP